VLHKPAQALHALDLAEQFLEKLDSALY